MPVPQHASQPLTLDELERRLPRQRVILIEDRAPSNPDLLRPRPTPVRSQAIEEGREPDPASRCIVGCSSAEGHDPLALR